MHEYSEYVGRFLLVPTGEVGKYGHGDNKRLLQLILFTYLLTYSMEQSPS